MHMFNKKTIIKKSLQIGWCTQISRLLGIGREILMSRFLGASALSDAFFTAYKIPNSLRRAFAEGALSAAFVPPIVKKLRNQDKTTINGLMSLAFIVFEGLCLLLVIIALYYTQTIIKLIAPGFSPDQITTAAHALKILMPFILCVSSSALLAGPLQAIGHFLIPALSPIFLNLFFIGALICCITYSLSINFLCWIILASGIVQFAIHLATFFYYQFSFGVITKDDVRYFSTILINFALCLPSVSIEEINLFIDTSFASLLSKGSISTLYLANRFMGIPLGIFAVSLSTVLLPHFSHIQVRAPNRLSFYLFESSKLVLWVTTPIALCMAFFSQQIFTTLFLSERFSLTHAHQAGTILVTFLSGLFFFSINKILLNIYYALHVTWIPAVISIITVTINCCLNSMLIDTLDAQGLALASVLAEIVRTILFVGILAQRNHFKIYGKKFSIFLLQYSLQLVTFGIPCLALYYGIWHGIANLPYEGVRHFLLNMIGYWLWVGPLCCFYFFTLWYIRPKSSIKIFFLD